MDRSSKRQFGLVDRRTGRPLSPHIQRALFDRLPRFKREFPSLQDEAVVAEILEETGSRIAELEERPGTIERLEAYTWVALRRTAVARLRQGSMRIVTVGSEESEAALATIPAKLGSAAQIEREILYEEALGSLKDEEREVCVLKSIGFSSREIAKSLGPSVTTTAVNTIFHRAKAKIRRILGVQ